MPEYLVKDEKSGREWLVESPTPPDQELVDKITSYGSLSSQAKGFGKSVVGGAAGLGGSVYKGLELAMYANPAEWQARLTKKLTGLDVPIPSEFFRGLAEEGQRQKKEYEQEALETGAGPITRGIGQALPSVLTAVLPGALLRAPAAVAGSIAAAGTAEAAAATEAALTAAQIARAARAGAAVAGTTSFGQSMLDKEEEYFWKLKNENPDRPDEEIRREAQRRALAPALAQGAIEGGTTLLMPGGVEAATAARSATAETAKKFLSKETLKKMGLGAGKEAVEENISALGQTAVDIVSTKPELNPFTAPNAEEEAKRWKSLYDQVVTTTGVAGVLGAAGAGVAAKVEGDFATAKESERMAFDAAQNAALEKQRVREAALQKLSDAALLKARVEATAEGPFSAQFETKDGKIISKDFSSASDLQRFENRLGLKAIGFEKKPVQYSFLGGYGDWENRGPSPSQSVAAPPAAPPTPTAQADQPAVRPLAPEATTPQAAKTPLTKEVPPEPEAFRAGYGDWSPPKSKAFLGGYGDWENRSTAPSPVATTVEAAPTPTAPAPAPAPAPVAQATTVVAPTPATPAATPAAVPFGTELGELREAREKAAAAKQPAIGTKELADASVAGADLYHGGAEDFNLWSGVMFKRFGAKIAPHLNQMYANIRDPKFLKNLRQDFVPHTQDENAIASANSDIATASKTDPNLSGEAFAKIEAEAVRSRFAEMTPAARSVATGKVSGFFREWFTTNKGLPPKLHRIVQGAGQHLAAYVREFQSNRVQLERAFEKVYGFKMEDAKGEAQVGHVARIMEAAKTAGLDSGIHPEVAKHVLKSRELIDKLSAEAAYFIDKKGLDPELAASIRADIGQYQHRTYRIFDDEDYRANIKNMPEYDKVARGYMGGEGNLTLQEARHKLQSHLNDLTGLTDEDRKLANPFKHRKDLDPAYRKLLGEYTNPALVIARTTHRLAQKVTRARAQVAFLEEGISAGVISHESSMVDGHNTAVPTGYKDAVIPGYRTTPEMALVIKAYYSSFDEASGYLSALVSLSNISKVANTVFSLRTTIDNFLGQPFWLIAAGHFNPAYINEAVRTTWASEFGTPEQKSSPLILKLIRLGILTPGVGGRQVSESLEYIRDKGIESRLLGTKKDSDVTSSIFSKIYNAPDSTARYIGFMTERDRLASANPGVPIETIEEMAAERARATYPTGGNMPKALQTYRSVPLLGTYVGFWWESQRVIANNIRLGLSDLASSNPKMRAYGALKLGGVLAALSFGDILKHMIESLLGTARSEEEEELDRKSRPWWSKNQDVIYLSKDRRKEDTWNPSNILPWTMYRSSLRAIARGANGEDAEPSILRGSINAARSYFGPVLQQDMFLAAAFQASNNKDRFGRPIVADEDDPLKPIKLTWHVINNSLMPGTPKRIIENILPVIRGEVATKRSEDVTVGGEIRKELGLDVRTTDKQRDLEGSIMDFAKKNKDLEAGFRKIVFREKPISPTEISVAYDEMNRNRRELHRRMAYVLNAKRRAGFSEEEIVAAVTKGGVSLDRREKFGLLKGGYIPYIPSQDLMQGLKRQTGRTFPPGMLERAVSESMAR